MLGSPERPGKLRLNERTDTASNDGFDENPQHRYMVVPNKDEAGWAVGGLIREMVQLNQNQPHAFTRDELIAMMDKAIAEESGTAEAEAE